MKLFKSIDDRFEELGFIKVEENVHGACYERENQLFGYIQTLDILHKSSGRHIVQSYQKGLNKDGFNNCVGLTKPEMKLCIKKMKQLKF